MSVTDEYLERLVTQRARAWNEGKEILERASAADRQMDVDERAKWNAINTHLDELDAEIKQLSERAQTERENDIARAAVEPLVRQVVQPDAKNVEDELRAFFRGEAGRVMDIDLTVIAKEKRMIREGADPRELRDLYTGATTNWGNAIPTTFVRRLYDFLEVYTGMRRTNATIVTTASGEAMDFPKTTLHGTAALTVEGSAFTENDPQVSKMTLNAYKYGQLLQVSFEMLQDTGVDLEGFLAKDLGRALGRVTDTAYVLGNGSSQPHGIAPAVAVGVGTAVVGDAGRTGIPTVKNLFDLLYSVHQEYRAQGAQWLTSDANAGKLRSLVDTTGRPLWEPSLQVGGEPTLLGYSVITDPNIAAFGTGSQRSLLFGDTTAFYIRDVGAIRIERSDEFAFDKDLVTYRSALRTDSDLIDLTGAIKLYTCNATA